MKYKNLCTVYCFHHGSLERCWHLNARLLGDVRMRPASGLSWGRGYGAGVLFGFWFKKSIASSQMQGQWGQCWTHTAPLRNKGARWLLHCAFLVKMKKKNSKSEYSRSCSSKERLSLSGNPWLHSVPEGSFLSRSLMVWYVIQNILTDSRGNLAGGRGHGTSALWK